MREKLKKMREDVWHGPCYTNADVAIMEDICKKLPDAEILEPVTFAGISDGKRNTEKQASLYDAMMAEFMGEKDARLRKYLRNHEIRSDGHPVRKEKRKSYTKRMCDSLDPWHGWDTVRKFREIEAEKSDARDWKLESAEIAEEEEWERFNRELEEFDRKWREEAEAEQRKMREYRKMRELNEWLKYA